jgi:hypothetical protein
LAALLTLVFASLVSAQPPNPASPEHAVLKKDVGVWDAESTFWMVPGQPPMVAKGVETNSMLGDIWLVSEFKCKLGDAPFQGHGQTGYDPINKRYVGTWIDNVNPHLATLSGSYDEESKSFTFMSKGIDAMTGKPSVSKLVSKHLDDDHRNFTTYDQVPGKEDQWRKTMEIKYIRRSETGQ